MPVEVNIPAGATTATMTIAGIANVANANPATAIFTLSPDAAYTVGSSNVAALTIASSSASTSAVGRSRRRVCSIPAERPRHFDSVRPDDHNPHAHRQHLLRQRRLRGHGHPDNPTTPATPPRRLTLSRKTRSRVCPSGRPTRCVSCLRRSSSCSVSRPRCGSAPVSEWNFIVNGTFNAPATSEFASRSTARPTA